MKSRVPAAVFLALFAISVYGFCSRQLWHQHIWDPVGAQRFLIFLAIAAVWFGFWVVWRPARMIAATIALVAVYSIVAVGLAPIAAAAFLLFACFVIGRLVIARQDGMADLVSLLAGLSLVIWIVTLAAHFPVNYPAAYLGAFAGVFLIRPRTTWQCARRVAVFARPMKLDRREAVMLALALVPLLAHWLVALTPEVSVDALSMHLVVPAYVANHHQWSFDYSRFVWAVMPMGAVWSYTVAYLLGGEFAAKLLNVALMAVTWGLLYTGARRWISRSGALLVAALFAATPMVQLIAGSLFVETFYAVLLVGAVASLWLYHDDGGRGWLIVCALLLASSMGVKLMALPFAAVAGTLLLRELWLLWRKGERIWLPVEALVIVALAPVPYLYSWHATGNPMFPYVNSIFRSPYFAPVMTPDPRFSEPLTWHTPFDVTFETHRYWEGQDGSVGFHLLLLAPLALLVAGRKWRLAEWSLVLVAAGGALLGLILRPNARYLYPAVPLLTLCIALVLARAKESQRWVRQMLWSGALLCLGMNLWFLPSSSFYHKSFCLNPLEKNAKERFLAEAAPVRVLIDQLNREHPRESALFLETMDIAGLRGDAWSNGWHSYLFMKRLEGVETGPDAFRILRELGIRHFVYPNPDYPRPGEGAPVRESQLRWVVDRLTRPEGECGPFRLAGLRPEFMGADAVESAINDDRWPPLLPPGRYDDLDPRVRFVRQWSHDTQFADAAHHSLTYSDIPSAAFQLTFRGSAISWVYTKALNRGMAEVLVDGKQQAEVDLYSAATVWQSKTSIQGLPAGEHTFEVRILGRRNPLSSGNYVDVDELIIE